MNGIEYFKFEEDFIEEDVRCIPMIVRFKMDLAGIKLPGYIRGIKQDTIQGTSLYYSITDAKAASRHTKQYYYIFGSRSIYKDGWKAATASRTGC